MSTPASRAVALLTVALGACTSSAAPPAPVLPAIPPAVAPPPAAPAPGCVEAGALVEKVRSEEKKHSERCAVRAAKRARSLCPSLIDPSVDRVAALEEAWRNEHDTGQILGPWLLESITRNDETRVWELGPSGPKLRFRIDSHEVALMGRDRLRVDLDPDLAIIDPRAGTVVRVDHARFLGEGRDYVFVGDQEHARRLRLADLGLAGTVAWKTPFDPMSGSDDGRELRGGEALVVRDVLVSFDRKSVLRAGLLFGSARPDGARILACDPASKAMLEIDAATGAELARFALAKGMQCEENGAVMAEASYAPDPRYAFWIERGRARRDSFAIVVAVGDTQTGSVRRFEDPSETWSIAISSKEHVDEGSPRLCADLRSFHGGWTLCNWKLAAGGRVVRDEKPATGPALAAIGLAGAVEVARVWTPKHDRLLVLTFRRQGEDIKKDLRLTIAGEGGKVERAVVLEAGEFLLDDYALREPWRARESAALPSLELVDETHASVSHGAGNLADMVVDLRTGVVSKPCSGREDCRVVGRFAVDSKGDVRDVVTGGSFVLAASAAEWAAAPRVETPCP